MPSFGASHHPEIREQKFVGSFSLVCFIEKCLHPRLNRHRCFSNMCRLGTGSVFPDSVKTIGGTAYNMITCHVSCHIDQIVLTCLNMKSTNCLELEEDLDLDLWALAPPWPIVAPWL